MVKLTWNVTDPRGRVCRSRELRPQGGRRRDLRWPRTPRCGRRHARGPGHTPGTRSERTYRICCGQNKWLGGRERRGRNQSLSPSCGAPPKPEGPSELLPSVARWPTSAQALRSTGSRRTPTRTPSRWDVTSGTLDRCADACAEGIGRYRTDKGRVVSDRSQGSVKQPLTALHDATTGTPETSAACDRPDGEKAVASPDGRFVAAGRHPPAPPRGHPRSRPAPENHRRLPVPRGDTAHAEGRPPRGVTALQAIKRLLAYWLYGP